MSKSVILTVTGKLKMIRIICIVEGVNKTKMFHVCKMTRFSVP